MNSEFYDIIRLILGCCFTTDYKRKRNNNGISMESSITIGNFQIIFIFNSWKTINNYLVLKFSTINNNCNICLQLLQTSERQLLCSIIYNKQIAVCFSISAHDRRCKLKSITSTVWWFYFLNIASTFRLNIYLIRAARKMKIYSKLYRHL